MTDKVQEIRKEIERLRSLHQIKYQHLDTNDNMCLVECGMRNLCNDLLLFIDSLQEEPVSSVWHDASEPPIIDKTFLLVAPNGNSSLCLWGGKELHSVTIGGGHSVLCKGDIYSYIDDLLNLDNFCNFRKNLQEEPVRRTLADIESAMQEVEEKSKAFTEAHQGEDADTILAQMRGEEPVNKDLEKAAMAFAKHFGDWHYAIPCFQAGALWQKEHHWKSADGDDLPEIDREVVAFQETFPTDVDAPSLFKIVIAHRPNPKGYDGKSIATGKVEHYTPKTYDKGGWNIPDVVLWLDLNIPNLEED